MVRDSTDSGYGFRIALYSSVLLIGSAMILLHMSPDAGYHSGTEADSYGDSSDTGPLECRWCGSTVGVTPSPFGGGICAQCRARAADFWANLTGVRAH